MKVKELKEYLKNLNDEDLICITDWNFPDDFYDLKFEDISNTSELEKGKISEYHQVYHKKKDL